MQRIILILLVALTIVKTQEKPLEIDNIHDYFITNLRSDDYYKMNQRQYNKNIKDYDLQIEKFKEIYTARTKTISIQLDMLVDGLILNDERLNPLEVLSDFSKQCVLKYRPKIPTIAFTKTTIQTCSTTANNQVNSLIATPQTTRNNLQNYYTNNFEKEKINCDKKFEKLKYNHTICLTNLVSTTNTVTVTNQKLFATQMGTIECTANGHIMKALDCSFTAQNRTISLMAEANTLINRCIENLYDSTAIVKDHSCSDIYFMRQSQVDFKNFTMTNPFYGRNKTSECLMLKLY